MPAPPLDEGLVTRLYERSNGAAWALSREVFAEALATSAERLVERDPGRASDLARRLEALHVEDLALACACAAGNDAAWEHFVREQRPVLYRAADALDKTGGARELADAIYADLFGLPNRDGRRASLFRYFHGRSSLSTWLRAVLAQRYIDRLRSGRRLEPLPDEEERVAYSSRTADPPDPERPRYLALIRQALGRAVARLDPRDRLRLGCYYGQAMTLAETGRLLGEHEATASRNVARTRKAIRRDVENQLRTEAGLNDAQILRCFEVVSEDAGTLDLGEVLPGGASEAPPERSTGKRKTS